MHEDDFNKGMRGEFRGDFTRDTFDPFRHFSRVLMQQGRVQLDSDWNEQVSILTHYFRMLGADLMGPHVAPLTVDGDEGQDFKIETSLDKSELKIGIGHYYVNGICCENDDETRTLLTQPNLPFSDAEMENPLTKGKKYLVYLDVWERHVSYVEDDFMREKALGHSGPDTATRAKIVWQVKVKKHEDFKENPDFSKFNSSYTLFFEALTKARETKPGTGRIQARARKVGEDDKNPCLTSPEARYRGTENQLYRVEIHKNNKGDGSPTFKWSRENGSVIFPIKKIEDNKITLEHLGRDKCYGLEPNDWVEIIDDNYILQNRAADLLQVEETDPDNMQVTLKTTSATSVGKNSENHPYLRRWDQKDGDSTGVPVHEGDQDPDWILLEDGVEIRFSLPEGGDNINLYQTGDYWLIPARTATGDVEWPGSVEAPESMTPQGVEHHYAPLCNISVKPNGDINVDKDLRRKLIKNWEIV